MKKKFSILPLFVFSITFFYSCKTGGSGEAYSIKMRLNKGDTFMQDMQMNMEMNAAVVQMKMKMNTATSFEVTNSDTAEKVLKMTYKRSK